MMGRQADYQHKLFITGFNLDKRIPKDHILRDIHKQIDFDFIYSADSGSKLPPIPE